jgi:hypothetical protein
MSELLHGNVNFNKEVCHHYHMKMEIIIRMYVNIVTL